MLCVRSSTSVALLKGINIFFFRSTNKFLAYCPQTPGVFCSFYLPGVFFYSASFSNKLKLRFYDHFTYASFLAHLQGALKRLKTFYFLKLRLRGLGYRIRRYLPYFYRFYFTRTNYIYFHVPKNILVCRRKKRVLLLSTDYHLVRLVFANLMLLHQVGPYNRRGFSYPRQIILLKAIKKIV